MGGLAPYFLASHTGDTVSIEQFQKIAGTQADGSKEMKTLNGQEPFKLRDFKEWMGNDQVPLKVSKWTGSKRARKNLVPLSVEAVTLVE